MAKKEINIPRDRNIMTVPIEEAMPDNYLPYAVEVAKERALPDVRDGLKPVHRRILYQFMKQWLLWHRISQQENHYLMDMGILDQWMEIVQQRCVILKQDFPI